jgi:hypothetical protein
MRYSSLLLMVFFSLTCIALNRSDAQQVPQKVEEKDHPLAVAIFSRNKTRDANNDKYADMLRSGLVSQLSDKFTVIDKDDVMNVFDKEAKMEKNKGSTITDFWSFVDTVTKMKQEEKKQDKESNVDNTPMEEKSSALRISQAIGANYFLIADVEEIVSNNIKDTVYGNQINDMNITADLSVKILDGVRGGSIVAESVRVVKRLHGDEKTTYTNDDVTQALPLLMKQAATEVSKKFLDNIERIKGFKVDAVQAKFKVTTNVPNATVELDGMAIGSAPGAFQAMSGAHRIRITKDGYRDFERDVNVYDNAEFSVSLEKTDAQTDEELKQQKADADNYATKKDADANYKNGTNKSSNW